MHSTTGQSSIFFILVIHQLSEDYCMFSTDAIACSSQADLIVIKVEPNMIANRTHLMVILAHWEHSFYIIFSLYLIIC